MAVLAVSHSSHAFDFFREPWAVAIGLGLVAVFTALVASTLSQYHRLRDFDGPFTAKLSSWWLVRTVASGHAYLTFWDVTNKYGSIARVGPNDLITSDPDLIKHMYKARGDYTRSSWYEGMRFNPSRDNLLSLRSEAEHTKLRAKMASGYSGRDIDNLEPKVDANVLSYARLIASYVDANKVLDFGRKTQYFTMDVISDIAFDRPFGFIETDSDVYKYIETTEETLPFVMVTTVIPWLLKLLKSPLMKPLLPSAKDTLGFGRLMGIAKDVAAERFGPDKKVQNDMLGSFVAHGLSQEEAESEILLQVIAGSDTTATAIRSTMLHIITSPRVLGRLRDEIATTKYTSAVIPDSEARKMTYLQAVIKEGLRIFPPVAGLMAKQVPPEGDHFKNKFLPGGTRIGICAWGIFRRPDIWGPDAGEFRPERWLDLQPSRLQEMESILDLNFSYGRWQCLGRPVALMELNKIFVHLLRHFNLTVCDPTNPWKVNNCGIFAQTEFFLRAERREI